jgi:drug/metabolite transporter (DMT)-like permease
MNLSLKGIFAGLLAGAFWGTSFLIPRMLPGASPSEISLGRFLWFGIFSFGSLLFHHGFRKSAPLFRFWRIGVSLSLAGFSLYYLLLVAAIQFAGIPVSSLIVGLLPISIALLSRDSPYSRRQFYVGIGLICLGLIVLNFESFRGTSLAKFPHVGIGIFLSVICMALWTFFAIGNARFLRKHSDVSSMEWASALGVYSALTMGILAFGMRWVEGPPAEIAVSPFVEFRFLMLTGVLGLFPTFIATRLWNFASRALPTGLVAQLIVSETLFALIYSFAYERRCPTRFEGLAMTLVVGGILFAVRAYSKPPFHGSKL